MVDIIWTIWYGKKSIFKYSYGPYQMGLYHMDHMIWKLVLPYNTVFLLCSFHTNSIVLLITNIIIPKSVLNIHWDTIFISLVPVIWFSLCPMCIAENKGFKTRNKIQHPVFFWKVFPDTIFWLTYENASLFDHLNESTSPFWYLSAPIHTLESSPHSSLAMFWM